MDLPTDTCAPFVSQDSLGNVSIFIQGSFLHHALLGETTKQALQIVQSPKVSSQEKAACHHCRGQVNE